MKLNFELVNETLTFVGTPREVETLFDNAGGSIQLFLTAPPTLVCFSLTLAEKPQGRNSHGRYVRQTGLPRHVTRHQPPGSTRLIVLRWNAATLCWLWHMSSVSTGVLESYSPLRLSISVSYPDFNSSNRPPPSSLHDGGALILHFMCCPASPVFSLHFLKPEDPGCSLGSIVVLCCWLSGEAAPP